MLIILEGADGAGKSTFAKRIADHLRTIRPHDTVEVLHRGKPKLHPLDEYVAPLIDYRPGSGHHIICDRWHWGELVYPKVKSRATTFDDPTFRYAELFLQARGALAVHVWRDLVELQDVFRQRGEFVLTSDELALTQRLFTTVENSSMLRKMIVRPDETDVVPYVIAEAARAEVKSYTIAKLTTYVGPPQVDTLLLGDVRNLREGDNPNGPAFMPYPSTSGAFLMRALVQSCALSENTVGIANACDVDSVRNVVDSVRPLRIVTLGNNAYEACRAVYGTGAFGSVPHPQYVRRFHNAHSHDYGMQILTADYNGEDRRSWRP